MKKLLSINDSNGKIKHFEMVRLGQIFLFGIIIGGALLSSCQKEETGPSTVVGTITSHNVNTPSITTPLEGIQVLLLDAQDKSVSDIMRDEVTLDSVFTDANGQYRFDGLLPGSYAIMPVDTTRQHVSFDVAAETSSPYFEVTENSGSFNLDFSAPEPQAENSGEGFTIRIDYENVPEAAEYKVQVLRLESWLYLPADYISVLTVNKADGFENTFQFEPPWQTVLGTQYNDLEIDFVLYEDSWLGLSRFAYKTFSIDIPREGYPGEMHFRLDWATDSFERTDS